MKKKLLFLILFLCIITKAQIYDNVLSFHNGANTPISNGIKIKTNIPFVQSSDIPTINIEGFADVKRLEEDNKEMRKLQESQSK